MMIPNMIWDDYIIIKRELDASNQDMCEFEPRGDWTNSPTLSQLVGPGVPNAVGWKGQQMNIYIYIYIVYICIYNHIMF